MHTSRRLSEHSDIRVGSHHIKVGEQWFKLISGTPCVTETQDKSKEIKRIDSDLRMVLWAERKPSESSLQ